MNKFITHIFVFIFILFYSCSQNIDPQTGEVNREVKDSISAFSPNTIAEESNLSHLLIGVDTTMELIDSVKTEILAFEIINRLEKEKFQIKIPENNNGATILLLPGWDFNCSEWCTKTSLCSKALKLGYTIVLAEMKKSIYHSQTYPETKEEWCIYPTRSWLIDTALVIIQNNFNILKPHSKNFIVGLSTGGRGVGLISLDKPDVFTAGASLSGDFNQARMQNDNLCRGYYGPYTSYSRRWIETDNVIFRSDEIKVPLYIGHAAKDNVVPADQSQELFDSLVTSENFINQTNIVLHIDTMISTEKAHSYYYWDSEVDNVLDYFSRFRSN